MAATKLSAPSSSEGAGRPITPDFGYKPAVFKFLISRFRHDVHGQDVPPLLVLDGRGRPPGRARRDGGGGSDEAHVADRRALNLTAGRRLQRRASGILRFLPLTARVHLDRLVGAAAYPGSEMVPASAAILVMLAMRLLDKERRSHIDDVTFGDALGLFAALNILPEKSFATAYSCRTMRENQLGLLRGWCAGSP